MINLPIIYRFSRLMYRSSSIARTGNLPIFNRLNSINYRSRRFSGEFRMLRQNNLPIVNPCAAALNPYSTNPSIINRRGRVIHRSSNRGGTANRKIIVNRFSVFLKLRLDGLSEDQIPTSSHNHPSERELYQWIPGIDRQSTDVAHEGDTSWVSSNLPPNPGAYCKRDY
jgi:hypothetical protein